MQHLLHFHSRLSHDVSGHSVLHLAESVGPGVCHHEVAVGVLVFHTHGPCKQQPNFRHGVFMQFLNAPKTG